eukprot:scaffold1006_cov408-Prasinococcus_capsulatus_cf.AAC.5
MQACRSSTLRRRRRRRRRKPLAAGVGRAVMHTLRGHQACRCSSLAPPSGGTLTEKAARTARATDTHERIIPRALAAVRLRS